MTKQIWEKGLHEQIKYARKTWENGPSRLAWGIYTDHLGLGCKDGTEKDYIDLIKMLENDYLIQEEAYRYIINRDKFNYSNDFYTQNF